MKKFSSSSQMFSENLKKYLKRAGTVSYTHLTLPTKLEV